jgi:hypothetical protein
MVIQFTSRANRGLDRKVQLTVEEANSVRDFVLRDLDGFRNQAAENREGKLPNREREKPVRDAFGVIQFDWPPCLQRSGQFGRTDRLHANDPNRRLERSNHRCHAGNEPAAAYRHQNGLDLGPFLEYLQSAGRLPGNDIEALEWRYHHQALLLCHGSSLRIPLSRAVAGDYHFRALPSDTLDFDHRGALRHYDYRPHPH